MGYEGKKGFIPFHTGFNSASSTVRGPSMQSPFPKCFSYMFALRMYRKTISILYWREITSVFCLLGSSLTCTTDGLKQACCGKSILYLPSQPPLLERLNSNYDN